MPSIYKKQKHLLGKIFGPSYTSNRIYLLRNYFSNYAYYQRDVHKKELVSVLRILLICKFLNFTAVFTKKNFPKFAYNFHVKKLITV